MEDGLPSICYELSSDCLTCPVCFCRYVNPKNLPSCGHIVCERCLKGCHATGKNLHCPVCRCDNSKHIGKKGVAGLPDSHQTKRIVEMVEKREKRARERQAAEAYDGDTTSDRVVFGSTACTNTLSHRDKHKDDTMQIPVTKTVPPVPSMKPQRRETLVARGDVTELNDKGGDAVIPLPADIGPLPLEVYPTPLRDPSPLINPEDLDVTTLRAVRLESPTGETSEERTPENNIGTGPSFDTKLSGVRKEKHPKTHKIGYLSETGLVVDAPEDLRDRPESTTAPGGEMGNNTMLDSKESKFQCPICQFVFPDFDCLEVHVNMCLSPEPDPTFKPFSKEHSKNKREIPRTTYSTFIRGSKLQGLSPQPKPRPTHAATVGHLRHKIPGDDILTDSGPEKPTSSKRFSCPRCEREFATLVNVQYHVDKCIPDNDPRPTYAKIHHSAYISRSNVGRHTTLAARESNLTTAEARKYPIPSHPQANMDPFYTYQLRHRNPGTNPLRHHIPRDHPSYQKPDENVSSHHNQGNLPLRHDQPVRHKNPDGNPFRHHKADDPPLRHYHTTTDDRSSPRGDTKESDDLP